MRIFAFAAIISTISVASHATDPNLPTNGNAGAPAPIVVKVEDDSAANVCSTVASQTREVACPSSHNQGGNLKYTEKGTFNCTTEQWEWTNLAASDINSIYKKCYKTVPNKVCTNTYQTMKKSCNVTNGSYCMPILNTSSGGGFRVSEWNITPNTSNHEEGCNDSSNIWNAKTRTWTKYTQCAKFEISDFYYLKSSSSKSANLWSRFTKKTPTTTCKNQGTKNVYYPN